MRATIIVHCVFNACMTDARTSYNYIVFTGLKTPQRLLLSNRQAEGGGAYSRAGFIRGRRLFHSMWLCGAVFIRERRLIE